MAVYLIDEDNKPRKAHYVGVLTEPSSYQMTATPEEMQRGTTAIVKGKIVEGTGKCFAFATYGQTSVYPICDENGNERYGFIVEQNGDTNILFLSSTAEGDTTAQDVHVIGKMQEGKAEKIGVNKTTLTDIFAFQLEGVLFIYCVDLANADTAFNFFIGKDNKI